MASISPPFFHAVQEALEKFTYHADREAKKKLAEEIDQYDWINASFDPQLPGAGEYQ